MLYTICAHLYVHTLVNACLVEKNTPPVQVAAGDGSIVASHVCTLVNVLVGTRKRHKRKLKVMPTAIASEVFALMFNGRK